MGIATRPSSCQTIEGNGLEVNVQFSHAKQSNPMQCDAMQCNTMQLVFLVSAASVPDGSIPKLASAFDARHPGQEMVGHVAAHPAGPEKL